jgi:DNA-binding NtrC family response regulator
MIEPGPSRAPAPRLLVVDDDEVVLRAFERTFRRSYDLCTVTSGVLALAALEERQVDVLITDFSMPVMNGLDLLREVMTRHPEVARLMLTAHADVPEVVALKQQGLVGAVLMKPWSREEVEGAVTQALRLASMRRAVAGLQVQVGPARP